MRRSDCLVIPPTTQRAPWPAAWAVGLALLAAAACAQGVDTRLTDGEFFASLDLSLPGLERAASAVQAGDLGAAKHELAAYFRGRTSPPYRFDPHAVNRDIEGGEQAVSSLADQLAGRGFFAARTPEGDLQWVGNPEPGRYPTRMYWWEALGRAYWATGDEAYTRQWLWQLHSFIRQCPAPDPGVVSAPYWNTMDTGIRLRGSWLDALFYFLHSPEFGDADIVLFLKSLMEQARFIIREHRGSTNWVTFAMVGLYSAGAMFPEFKEAAQWRQHAGRVAVDEMTRLYLPDGFGNELSPGYHQFYTNFWMLQEIARRVGCEADIPTDIYALSEKPVAVYLHLMAPDRKLPRFNDSGSMDVPGFLQDKLQYYPQRQDLRWIATDGKEGTPPAQTSFMFPYAGYCIMRSGWERDANYLAFDVGPPGNSHVHQDKLNVVLWAYGRELLYDIGAAAYDTSVWRRYSVDTHSHNTVMVDGRPQRRRWKVPGPDQMPYQPLTDVRWETGAAEDFAAGICEQDYGAVGMPEFYPYTDRAAFAAGWAKPATHERRVAYLKPDVFVVADILRPTDEAPHRYQARWHLLTTHTTTAADTGAVVTTDEGQPNLAIVPLLCEGLQVRAVSAQMEPELLGWNALSNNKNTPTTSVTHTLEGPGTRYLLTLLLPLRPGQGSPVQDVKPVSGGADVTLAGGRRLQIRIAQERLGDLTVQEMTAAAIPRQ
jgi:hypothetical protein